MHTCHYEVFTVLRISQFVCSFEKAPTFSVRGLCKESVMDIQYKFAEQNAMDQTKIQGIQEWGLDSTRSYVGPKGWKITRSPDDKLWRMKHRSYQDLTLTMLDIDTLPIGRHQWMVEKNVCN